MTAGLWAIGTGLLLASMVLFSRHVDRLPVSPALVYLLVGVAVGPAGLGWLRLAPQRHAGVLELVCEAIVLLSLFAVGLKLGAQRHPGAWKVGIRLASSAMLITIALVAAALAVLFDYSIGAALLVAAILAPTDPVLASEVQTRHPDDRDRLRFALSAEGGLNDGAAFPFVLLGLGALGAHTLGTAGSQWLLKDVAWAVGAGLAIGYLCGYAAARAAARFIRSPEELTRSGSLVLLGLVSISFGLATVAGAYAFLAVFAAAVAARRGMAPAATDAAAGDSHSLLDFSEQLERAAEFGIVMALGVMISTIGGSWTGVAVAALMFGVARPIAVWFSVRRRDLPSGQHRFLAWFGIRGVGSLYYLFFAAGQPIEHALATELISVVLTVVACSIVVHGISATSLMRRYDGTVRVKPDGP
jgi:NhaP-type Na+/H+ or K+/H+ antiporter